MFLFVVFVCLVWLRLILELSFLFVLSHCFASRASRCSHTPYSIFLMPRAPSSSFNLRHYFSTVASFSVFGSSSFNLRAIPTLTQYSQFCFGSTFSIWHFHFSTQYSGWFFCFNIPIQYSTPISQTQYSGSSCLFWHYLNPLELYPLSHLFRLTLSLTQYSMQLPALFLYASLFPTSQIIPHSISAMLSRTMLPHYLTSSRLTHSISFFLACSMFLCGSALCLYALFQSTPISFFGTATTSRHLYSISHIRYFTLVHSISLRFHTMFLCASAIPTLCFIPHSIIRTQLSQYSGFSTHSVRSPASSFNLLDLLSLQPFSVLFYLSCSIYFLILAGIFPLYIFYSKLFYVLFLSFASLFLTFALSFIMFFIFSFAFLSLICNLF
jgi:hypothetical protein